MFRRFAQIKRSLFMAPLLFPLKKAGAIELWAMWLRGMKMSLCRCNRQSILGLANTKSRPANGH